MKREHPSLKFFRSRTESPSEAPASPPAGNTPDLTTLALLLPPESPHGAFCLTALTADGRFYGLSLTFDEWPPDIELLNATAHQVLAELPAVQARAMLLYGIQPSPVVGWQLEVKDQPLVRIAPAGYETNNERQERERLQRPA